jgi:D-threonine aldolase
MTSRPPAEPGMPFDDIETPALVIDLDRFEANLAAMADRVRDMGVRIRPHAKTHKSPIIAHKQIAHGAVGVCCQKVGEAEVMVEGGVADVLVSNEVWGRRKLDRLAALARQARVSVCVDEPANIDDISAAAQRAGAEIGVLVELDVGAGRCGVTTATEAVDLARKIQGSVGLRFAGLQAYQGSAQHKRSVQEREEAIGAAAALTSETVAALAEAGLTCEIVGGAGTGTFEIEGRSGIWNELQAGSYVFMDADYVKNHKADGRPIDQFGHALFVVVTVMSKKREDRAVVDAGHKALGNDSGFPNVWGVPGATYERPSDEHGTIVLADVAKTERNAIRPGDRLLLVPGHCDPTVNLYDWYVAVRGMHTPEARVEAVWLVAARGALT